jgi:hypothetical protein
MEKLASDWRPWQAYYDQLREVARALEKAATAIEEIPGEDGSNARCTLGAVLELVETERRRAAARAVVVASRRSWCEGS